VIGIRPLSLPGIDETIVLTAGKSFRTLHDGRNMSRYRFD
jgi:hypothetical protein